MKRPSSLVIEARETDLRGNIKDILKSVGERKGE